MGKQNAFLAAHEAKLRAEYQAELDKMQTIYQSNLATMHKDYQGQLACVLELDLIALLLTIHDCYGVGPGRSDKAMLKYRDNRVEVSDIINEDIEADVDLTYSRRILADRVKAILGPENWRRFQNSFPLLREYWEEDPKE